MSLQQGETNSEGTEITIGTRFWKEFSGYDGRFRGTVTEVDGDLCAVEYDDGDEEHIDIVDVRRLLADGPKRFLERVIRAPKPGKLSKVSRFPCIRWDTTDKIWRGEFRVERIRIGFQSGTEEGAAKLWDNVARAARDKYGLKGNDTDFSEHELNFSLDGKTINPAVAHLKPAKTPVTSTPETDLVALMQKLDAIAADLKLVKKRKQKSKPSGHDMLVKDPETTADNQKSSTAREGKSSSVSRSTKVQAIQINIVIP